MIHWAWLIVAFAGGVGATLFLAFISSLPRPPRPPRCTAVLRSGETCLGDEGHSGPHRARAFVTELGHTQDYCWEDPNNGVHSVGFFRTR